MYQGRLVEQAATEDLFTDPRHPYTAMLLNAAPAPDPHAAWMEEDEDLSEMGEATESGEAGCVFAPRCRYASDMCRQQVPALQGVEDCQHHLAACHHNHEVKLKGV
jgi:peptide/nickel transport system ATP-binding protein